MNPSPSPFDQQKKLQNVKHVIAVAAGKGGVGKSTVATSLAFALEGEKKKVGLLDADIYGPSIPKMMGLKGAQPNVNAQNKIEPLVRYGIKTMSIGFMVDEKSAIIWRGPMLFKAIDQFLKDVEWGELDYLVVDLPPGTGDVQLSLVQKVLVSGAVIVSTPQDIALMDVKRCVDMFERVKIPVLGVVENMYKFVCPHCHQESDLFFKGELHKYCEEHKIQLLGQVPFNPKIGEEAEKGNPQTIEKDVFTRAAQEIIKKLG